MLVHPRAFEKHRSMRLSPTLGSYLTRELLLTTALGFLAAVPVVLIPNLIDRLGEFLVVGVTAPDLALVLGCAVLLVSAYSLPIAFLFGLLIGMGRLAADSELVALRACGASLRSFAVPALVAALLISVLSALLLIVVEPRAKRELTSLSLRLAARGSVIEVGTFQRFGPRMIYAQERSPERRLSGVMISDWTDEENPFLVFAESARLTYDDATGQLHLLLENGDLDMQPRLVDRFEDNRISFSRFDYAFQVGALGGKRWRFRPDQLTLSELQDTIDRAEAGDRLSELRFSEAYVYRAQVHRMLAIPVAPLLFALVGVPLGMGGFVRSRPRGLLLALLVLCGYYGLFVFGQDAARAGELAPALAIWLPNAVLGVAGAVLMRRAARGF